MNRPVPETFFAASCYHGFGLNAIRAVLIAAGRLNLSIPKHSNDLFCVVLPDRHDALFIRYLPAKYTCGERFRSSSRAFRDAYGVEVETICPDRPLAVEQAGD